MSEKKKFIYGPVPSRRLGRSYGIDIVPFKICTLDVFEFLRRFLQHVLPKGFVKVRYFGFLATKKRKELDHVKELIGKRLCYKNSTYPKKTSKTMTCPDCGNVLLFVCEIPKYRGPPW